MTTAAGLYIGPAEHDAKKQNFMLKQLAEGRSNAVGTVTLTHDGVATTTTVMAATCGPNSGVWLSPQTANAATALATTYVLASNVTARQFVITHAATTQADRTFSWACFG